MSWNKKVSINYHFIESGNEDFFTDFHNSMSALLKSNEPNGSFLSNEIIFSWEIISEENITESSSFFISLVKKKDVWPVWVDEENHISEIPLEKGFLGEVFYALINPAGKFMLSMAGSSGSAASSFKKFLNEFSRDGGIKLTPLFEEQIVSRTLSWDFYKKISASINFPTSDELAEFKTTKEGALLGLVDELGGLKVNITISTVGEKQVLNASQTKDIVQSFFSNDFCNKLVLKGSDFENEKLEEFDLKNAQIKFTEEILVEGSYVSSKDALLVLKKAFMERNKELLHLPE